MIGFSEKQLYSSYFVLGTCFLYLFFSLSTAERQSEFWVPWQHWKWSWTYLSYLKVYMTGKCQWLRSIWVLTECKIVFGCFFFFYHSTSPSCFGFNLRDMVIDETLAQIVLRSLQFFSKSSNSTIPTISKPSAPYGIIPVYSWSTQTWGKLNNKQKWLPSVKEP